MNVWREARSLLWGCWIRITPDIIFGIFIGHRRAKGNGAFAVAVCQNSAVLHALRGLIGLTVFANEQTSDLRLAVTCETRGFDIVILWHDCGTNSDIPIRFQLSSLCMPHYSVLVVMLINPSPLNPFSVVNGNGACVCLECTRSRRRKDYNPLTGDIRDPVSSITFWLTWVVAWRCSTCVRLFASLSRVPSDLKWPRCQTMWSWCLDRHLARD